MKIKRILALVLVLVISGSFASTALARGRGPARGAVQTLSLELYNESGFRVNSQRGMWLNEDGYAMFGGGCWYYDADGNVVYARGQQAYDADGNPISRGFFGGGGCPGCPWFN